jgi:hypothetical protein
MSLLTQPIEGLRPEHDPVVGRGARERRSQVVAGHT